MHATTYATTFKQRHLQVQANNDREAKCFGNIDAECGRLVLPPTVRRSSSSQQQLRGDHKLQNDILQYLEEKKVGWSPTLTKIHGCYQVVKVTWL